MKIVLLSNVTVEVLAGLLRKEHQVWMPSGFGAWMEAALDPPQDMQAFGPELICLLIDRRFGAFDAKVHDVATACARLRERFPKSVVIAPDVERLAADLGDGFYDEKMWKLGKMPFSIKGLRELAKVFSRKKAVAVDLDNTLWKGVVGEDGIAGIVPNAEFQDELLALKRRGILLVALSKNNPEDVGPVWADERMVLKESDFVAQGIDWSEKADNLERVAAELNLGTDAFVFVDDNPAERAGMRARRPEVAVADFPPQLDVFFPPFELIAEDVRKTEMYQAEAKRRDLAAGLSVEDYLKELQIRTDIHLAAAAEVPRIAQLSQKSNQFNACTNRYAEEDVAGFLSDPNRMVLTVHASDRFGDQGLISFVHIKISEKEAEIVDWVMSCRAMNRRIEFTVFDELKRLLASRDVRAFNARWTKTVKNVPVADLFDKLGFECVETRDDERRYRMNLNGG